MTLDEFGWRACFEAAMAEHAGEELEAGRVVAQDRGVYGVVMAGGAVRATVAGALERRAGDRADMPAVGDWVAIRRSGGGAVIVRVLPRTTAFVRKAAGARSDPQVVAANIDTVFLVTGLDGDFSVRRIERYLTVARASGARPVVVLNKADVASGLDRQLGAARARAGGAPVVAMSALDDDPAVALAAWLEPGTTVALIGSSGVGKSTIANRLLGEDRLRTHSVRGHDQTGRHTTTRRELVRLPCGALLVDTPGMREVQVWTDGDGVRDAFDDVAGTAAGCRFSDCRHDGEPGCAVEEAIESGALDADRLASFRTLEREAAYLETRRDQNARMAEKRRWKAIHKAMRNVDKRK